MDDVENDYFKGYLSQGGKIVKFGDLSIGITKESYDQFRDACHRRAIISSAALIHGVKRKFEDKIPLLVAQNAVPVQ